MVSIRFIYVLWPTKFDNPKTNSIWLLFRQWPFSHCQNRIAEKRVSKCWGTDNSEMCQIDNWQNISISLVHLGGEKGISRESQDT